MTVTLLLLSIKTLRSEVKQADSLKLSLDTSDIIFMNSLQHDMKFTAQPEVSIT